MSLQDELTRVREYLTDAGKRPSNEANTCHWVISPLLRHCGYDFHEIDVQTHDGAGKYPDFAILPHTSFTWFLEAKSWQENLADAHMIQAMNYAHTQGQRWVVLSNGREWRLYDDHIIGVQPADRLVAAARLDCSNEMERLLAALSKPSVQSGGLATFAVQERVAKLLTQQLQMPNSEVIKSITSTLKGKLGLSSVTPSDVAGFFQSNLLNHITTSLGNSTPSVFPASKKEEPAFSPLASDTALSLPDLLASGSAMQKRKPKMIILPDQSERSVVSWRDVTLETIEWLFTRNKRPVLPFRGRKSGKHYLISTTPLHSNGKAKAYKTLVINGETLYVDVNRSAPDFVSCLKVLCEEVGIEPAEILVRLKSG